MAIDEKRRQKKLAKEAAKRKAKKAQTRSQTAVGSAALAARFPICDCLVPSGLFEAGIGHLVLSRSLPGGDIAVAGFLVDTFCLGVKDALFRVISSTEYAAYLRQIEAQTSLERVHPSCLRKLVEGAVRYAQDLGFAPHSDYVRAARLFGDIDAAACPVRYTYGKDGQPFYVRGPHESAAQSRRILDTLARRLGQGGFHYLTPLGQSENAAAAPDSGNAFQSISYEITDDPLGDTAYAKLPAPVKDDLDKLYHLLRKKPGEFASRILPLIEEYPDVPQLYNYLHSAYTLLGDTANADRLLEEMSRRFPDYLFGRVAQAKSCLERGDLDKVSEIFEGKYDLKLLYPDRERFHISEVVHFDYIMTWYFHARGESDRAEMYYKILQQVAPEHELTGFADRLLHPSRIARWLNRLSPPR